MEYFEEPEPVEASHLLRTRCGKCGAMALACPSKVREARCGVCLLAETGAGGAYTGGYTVPVGYPLGVGSARREGAVAPPEVPAAGAWRGSLRGVPMAVADLGADAMAEGWEVRLRPAGTSWAVRGACRERFFLAVRRGDAWGSLWGLGAGALLDFPGMAVLREWIAGHGRMRPCWYEDVRVGVHMAGLKAEWLKARGVKRGTRGKRRESGG